MTKSHDSRQHGSPDEVTTKPEHGHVHDAPPVVSDLTHGLVPNADLEAQAVHLEQNGQPRAAAELRAKAAGEPPPDAQQTWLRAISLRKG